MTSHTDTVTGWIPIRFKNTIPIDTLRDSLHMVLNSPGEYTREENPHISMFGFELPYSELEGFQDNFNEEIADSLEGRKTGFDDFHIYPTLDNPMVISLDVHIDLEDITNNAINLLEQHNGSVRWGPTPAHVTLLKAGDAGEEDTWGELDTDTHKRLRQQVTTTTVSFERTIDSVTLELNY